MDLIVHIVIGVEPGSQMQTELEHTARFPESLYQPLI